nr:unnamed protein product [Callosobruchus chinensis]
MVYCKRSCRRQWLKHRQVAPGLNKVIVSGTSAKQDEIKTAIGATGERKGKDERRAELDAERECQAENIITQLGCEHYRLRKEMENSFSDPKKVLCEVGILQDKNAKTEQDENSKLKRGYRSQKGTFNRVISTATIRRRVLASGLRCRRPLRVPLLTARHRTARLQWARAHQDWLLLQWRNVLFSDECRFGLVIDDYRERVWREVEDKIV